MPLQLWKPSPTSKAPSLPDNRIGYDPRQYGADCDNCPCNGFRVVPPEAPLDGQPTAIIVGQEPGTEEVRVQKPFVGPSGKKVDRLLKRFGIDRKHLHVTNAALCVDGRSEVRMADGSRIRMDILVKRKHSGPVLTVESDGTIGARKITGWYRNPIGKRRLLHITHKYARMNANGPNRVIVTEDHRVLTSNGWCEAQDLNGQFIATGDLAPSKYALDIVLGTLLGDGCIARNRSHLAISHAEDQREYAELKAKAIRAKISYVAGVNGWQNKVRGNTYSSGFFRKLREQFYVNGKKIIPRDVIHNASDLLLAIWYLDDGCMHFREGKSPRAEICVAGFRKEDVEFAVACIRDKGFDCYVSKTGPYRIHFTVGGTQELSYRIAKYVPNVMQYKLIPKDRGKFDHKFYMDTVVPFFDEAIVTYAKSHTSVSVYCIDVDQTHCFVTTGAVVHNCMPKRDDDRPKAIKCCSKRLENELATYPTSVPIVPLGAHAFRSTFGRKMPIGLVRGFQWTKEDGREIYPTLHPAFVLRDHIQAPLMARDFRRIAKRIYEGKLELDSPKSFSVPRSLEELKVLLAHFKKDWVACDIETTEEAPTVAELQCIGISDVHSTIVIPWHEAYTETLDNFFKTKRVVGHNFIAFDSIVLARYRINIPIIEDTLIAHHCFASHMPQRLDHVVSMYLDCDPWKVKYGKRGNDEKGKGKKQLSEEDLFRYNSLDAYREARLWEEIQPDLELWKGLYEHDKLLAEICRDMQVNGVLVDVARKNELSEAIKNKESRLYKEMAEIIGRDFAPTKTKDIRDILFTQFKAPVLERTKTTNIPSTNKKVLQAFALHPDRPYGLFAKKLVELRGCSKMRTTYLDNLKIEADGRVHPSWRSFGTPNGRYACRKPNMQNLKRFDKRFKDEPEQHIRSIYIPKPGHVYLGFDASQIEMRVAAYISGDENFIKSCESGDMHASNARILFGDLPELLDPKEAKEGKGKPFRDISKNCGFAVNYGAGADKVFETLRSYGFPVKYQQVVIMLERLHKAFKVHFQRIERDVEYCQKHGHIKVGFLSGRIRWLGHAPDPQDCANSPIQAGAADVMNYLLIRIWQRAKEELGDAVKLVAQVHDSVLFEVPEELVFKMNRIITEEGAKKVLINGREVLFPIDRKQGYRWSEAA